MTEQTLESRSSVKLSLNAKGEAQVEVKVYDNFDQDELNATRDAAVALFNDTLKAVGR